MVGIGLLELTLFVSDVDASARFYEAAGFQLFCCDESGHPRHYDGDLGLQLWPASAKHPTTYIQLGFYVDDLARTVQRLDALGALWKCGFPNFVTTHDPDGNNVNLAQRRR